MPVYIYNILRMSCVPHHSDNNWSNSKNCSKGSQQRSFVDRDAKNNLPPTHIAVAWGVVKIAENMMFSVPNRQSKHGIKFQLTKPMPCPLLKSLPYLSGTQYSQHATFDSMELRTLSDETHANSLCLSDLRLLEFHSDDLAWYHTGLTPARTAYKPSRQWLKSASTYATTACEIP